MITVYGCANTRSQRVVWALEEAGAEYHYVKLNLLKGEGRKLPYIDLNPIGKVPTIVDADLVLTESAAICTYIGDKYPDSGLTPSAGTPERAVYNKWCFYVIGELEQPLWTIAKHRFAIPVERRVPQVIDTAQWEFSTAAKVLDKQLADKEFILGDQFTAADILIAHTLGWAKAYKVTIESERLTAYAQRALGRPALARARERESQNS